MDAVKRMGSKQRSGSSNGCNIMISFITLLSLMLVGASAFQLSMSSVGGMKPSGGRKSLGRPALSRPFNTPLPMPMDSGLSSGLISQLAEVALKLRLKEQTSVTCDANVNTLDLLRGSTGAVTVKGRGWRSELGLSCRAIEATVDSCELDVGKIMSKRKIVLRTPARGRAKIALNAGDFANFITHPLMQKPIIDGGKDGVQFLNDDVTIDPRTQMVTFYVKYEGNTYKCELLRSSNKDQRAKINVMPKTGSPDATQESEIKKISDSLSLFFNEMVFELDGTFLTFRDMMVTQKGIPSILLSLDIKVKKLPSRSMAF